MISRRHFLAASSAGVVAGGLAAASPSWAGLFSSVAGRRISIGETFVSPEWRHAFEASVLRSDNAADRVFWQGFSPTRAIVPAETGELHLLSLPAPGLEPFVWPWPRTTG
jgi:hypothetical protein